MTSVRTVEYEATPYPIPCMWRRSLHTPSVVSATIAKIALKSKFFSSLLDRDPGCKRLSWRYGISNNVLDKKLRVSEVANWLQFQVLPQRAKRGRG